jgi:hypothetical protein
VYLHVRDSDGVVFYVGKGTGERAKRAKSYKNWKIAKGDSTFTPIIYADSLSSDLALDYEKQLINSPYYEWDLCNMPHVNSKTLVLDKSELEKHFYYCSASPSGVRWARKNSSGNPACKKNIGDIAGYPHRDVRRNNIIDSYTVNCHGVTMSSHRVVWVLCGNSLISGMVIDHIDGDPLNNSIENLRQVSCVDNSLNRRKSINNMSGINGVYVRVRGGKRIWVVGYVTPDGTRKSKEFSSSKYGEEQAKQLAIEFRQEYEKTRNFSERHGK